MPGHDRLREPEVVGQFHDAVHPAVPAWGVALAEGDAGARAPSAGTWHGG